MTVRKKPGPNPIGKRALTQVEKNRRLIARQKLLTEEAKKHGYKPVRLFIHEEHFEAIREVVEEQWQNTLTTCEISAVLFGALKFYFEKAPSEVKTVHSENWPQVTPLESIEIVANMRFNESENQQ